MAFLIPENIRTTSTIPAARRAVATALAVGLDDGATVWYEPPFDPSGARPHFVVLDPEWGIAVVMVYDAKDTWALDDRAWAAASEFGARIAGELDRRPSLARVTVTGFVAFPNLARDAAEQLGFDTKVDLDRCLFPDELAGIRRGDDDLLPRHLRRVTEGGVGDVLQAHELDQLRGIIHPEIVIRSEPVLPTDLAPSTDAETSAQPTLLEEPVEDVTKVMDRKQERLAKGLGSSHRVIRGVAGSGKTLVLLSRARLLAQLMPAQRFLVTCYNRSLASSLRGQLSGLDNIEVRTIHQVIQQTLMANGQADAVRGNPDWEAVSALAVDAARVHRPSTYRAVLVDEAQDFDSDMLRLCTLLFESPDAADQDLIVVADLAQRLYGRQFTWKSAGIHAPGRSIIMSVNYRNTREILQFAHDVLESAPDVRFDEHDGENMGLVPPDSAERSGPRPDLVLVDSVEEEIESIIRCVAAWYRPELPPRSIGVLLATQQTHRLGERLARRLRQEGVSTFWATENNQTKDYAGLSDEPVMLSTIHSAKGFEFPRVLVAGLPATESAMLPASYRIAYVGMTRAVDSLTVIAPRTGILTKALVNASDHAATGVPNHARG